MVKKNNQLKISIYGYDVATIEEATKLVTEKISQLKLDFSRPVPLPNKKNAAAVIISPHKHKSSQEHFSQEIHRRVIHVFNISPADLDNLEILKTKISNTACLTFRSSL